MRKIKPELAPCPFCGGTDLNVVQWIECNDCGAFGPTPGDDGDLSIWNKREPADALHPIQQTLRENGDLIAAQATIAQQAQMIEHLRGGPTPLYTAVDMANADVRGRRSLGEHLIKQIAIEHPDQDTLLTVEHIAQWIALEAGL